MLNTIHKYNIFNLWTYRRCGIELQWEEKITVALVLIIDMSVYFLHINDKLCNFCRMYNKKYCGHIFLYLSFSLMVINYKQRICLQILYET